MQKRVYIPSVKCIHPTIHGKNILKFEGLRGWDWVETLLHVSVMVTNLGLVQYAPS
jgi:hypothetical protein